MQIHARRDYADWITLQGTVVAQMPEVKLNVTTLQHPIHIDDI